PAKQRASLQENLMTDARQFYIDGKWVAPTQPRDFAVVNPATEEQIATISMGSAADVDKAVAAAKRAFETFSETTVEQRRELLQRIVAIYKAKSQDVAQAISTEMGAPMAFAKTAQVGAGLAHFMEVIRLLENFPFEEVRGTTLFRKEPIGVCG